MSATASSSRLDRFQDGAKLGPTARCCRRSAVATSATISSRCGYPRPLGLSIEAAREWSLSGLPSNHHLGFFERVAALSGFTPSGARGHLYPEDTTPCPACCWALIAHATVHGMD